MMYGEGRLGLWGIIAYGLVAWHHSAPRGQHSMAWSCLPGYLYLPDSSGTEAKQCQGEQVATAETPHGTTSRGGGHVQFLASVCAAALHFLSCFCSGGGYNWAVDAHAGPPAEGHPSAKQATGHHARLSVVLLTGQGEYPKRAWWSGEG